MTIRLILKRVSNSAHLVLSRRWFCHCALIQRNIHSPQISGSGLSVGFRFVEHSGVISALAWISDEKLISGGSDGKLRWWDPRSGECVQVQSAHQGTVQALKISLDGGRLASGGDDGVINIWDLESGEHLQTLQRDRPYERLNITGIQGLTLAEIATLRSLGAIENPDVGST